MAPFRSEDLEARVTSLRQERETLGETFADLQAELRRLRPWSYRRFFLGLFTPIVALVLFGIAMSLFSFTHR
jgi:hypothetical protein